MSLNDQIEIWVIFLHLKLVFRFNSLLSSFSSNAACCNIAFAIVAVVILESSAEMYTVDFVRLADTSLLWTPCYCGQELKSRQIRIMENNSCYYRLSLYLRTPNYGPEGVRYSES